MRLNHIGNSDGSDRRPQPPAVAGSRRGAFTLIEMLIVMGIIVVLASLILATVVRTRSEAQGVTCLNNLKNIGEAFTLYAMDNNNYFPVPQDQGPSWESMLQQYTGSSAAFRCPADTEIWPGSGTSYDWRSNFDPLSSLSGKRRTDALRSDAVLAFESLPGWHQPHQMNAVRLDGSATPMGEDECLQDTLDKVLAN